MKPNASVTIVDREGNIRANTRALIAGSELAVIEDVSLTIEPGDEIRRVLPNGQEEAFEVIDPVFYDVGVGRIRKHYQVKMRRKGTFSPHTGGNYNIHVSGQNARVNIASQDSSQNYAVEAGTFCELRDVIQQGVSDEAERERLHALVRAMEAEKNKPGFAAAYQQFVASAANHVPLLAPFFHLLTRFFS